jgi:Polyketide cyclase / dehydrase and lipid transport
MPPIVSGLEMARPPNEVYPHASDPSGFPEWQDDVLRRRVQGGRPAGVGTKSTTIRRIGRVEQTTTQGTSPPKRSWAARGVHGPFRPSAGMTVEPLGDGTRSRVTIAADMDTAHRKTADRASPARAGRLDGGGGTQ